MPAINALLPIVAASNSSKQGTQNRAEQAQPETNKNAANAESKGFAQEAAAQKRMQEKRFINAYEEGIQEQGAQQERASQRAAERLKSQEDSAAALAASGSALPLEGGPLPTTVAVPAAANGGQSSAPTQASQSDSLNQPVPLAGTAEPILTADQQQQQQTADAFHSLVSQSNGKVDANGVIQVGMQQAARSATEQGVVVALTSDDNSVKLTSSEALPSDSALPNVANELQHQASINAAALEPEKGSAELVALPQEAIELPQVQAQSTQSAQGEIVSPQNIELALRSAEPDQAERVRAWRGIDALEMGKAAMQTATQSTRQDPMSASVSISHSGQIQQFAQSLRMSSGQADTVPGATSAERQVASTPQSGAENSPWRADSSASNPTSVAGRASAANTPFTQTMQASNFGQALGEKVGQNAWGESIAQRVSLMAGQKVSSAQIQLDPPELGAMTVKVSVTGDQATVSFHSPHAMVRDALELSFPRLQEMLGQQGMQLVDAQVSDNSSTGRGSGESARGRSDGIAGEMADEGASAAATQIVQVATGLIDFYA